jgi:hypothetical protein
MAVHAADGFRDKQRILRTEGGFHLLSLIRPGFTRIVLKMKLSMPFKSVASFTKLQRVAHIQDVIYTVPINADCVMHAIQQRYSSNSTWAHIGMP